MGKRQPAKYLSRCDEESEFFASPTLSLREIHRVTSSSRENSRDRRILLRISPSGARAYKIAILLYFDSPDTTSRSSFFDTYPREIPEERCSDRTHSRGRPGRIRNGLAGPAAESPTEIIVGGLSRAPDREDTANKSVNRTESRARATPGRVQSVFTQQANCDEIRDFWETSDGFRRARDPFYISHLTVCGQGSDRLGSCT